ncbi:unnamed protein product [Diamesa serratosioi]
MFDGMYNGARKHDADRKDVLERAWNIGVQKIVLTVGTIFDFPSAFKIANSDERLYCTVGCHPTRCGEFLVDTYYFEKLCTQIEEHRSKVIAIGEIGLDYDRLHFCEPDVQKQFFEKQLELADKYDLPLFLHCRKAHADLCEILERNKDKIRKGGVVHTFDGTLEEAKKLIAMGFHIGVNGCSIKTQENLDVIKEIPNDKLMIETDAPWCEIRPTHASNKHVKTVFELVKNKDKKKWDKHVLVRGRNEPVCVIQILEVISAIKNEDAEKLSEIFYQNTLNVFFPEIKEDEED